ncbi:MAG: phytanoyl-CoA dioxygenase family protein [Planctomycetota bacterium]|jgi:ectoine hydroxylase-related dioxygenase (phytanoyl-CoA dioxygenase family)|nr:phytanoyl-CoA dioxygenase family protein [Planctomycetota bacterium]MDP7254443.1 phytanoyl-CoA dioxygenase family protein [Planctomycetota bacterium]
MSATEFPEISQSDVEEYQTRGVWISPRLFDEEQVRKLRVAVRSLQQGEKDSDSWGWSGPLSHAEDAEHMFQAVNAWWVNETIREAVAAPVIGYLGARLMQVDGIRLIHDQALVKPGLGAEGEVSTAGNFGWHQDFSYWDWIDTDNLCTCWVALQDTDVSMGAMRAVIGSHRWGYNPESATAGEKDLGALRERFTPEGAEWLEEPCILKAGQASFHHSLTYHGSAANVSQESRMSVVSHLMPDGSAYTSKGKWNRMLSLMGPDLKHGDEFGGPVFPKLWPVSS